MSILSRVLTYVDSDLDCRYLEQFHPRLIGLTGTHEQIKKAAKAFRVYYSKPIDDDSDDYLVDHTIIMCLSFFLPPPSRSLGKPLSGAMLLGRTLITWPHRPYNTAGI